MASVRRNVLIFGAITTAYFGYRAARVILDKPPVPVIEEDAWFGPGIPEIPNFTVRPFKIQISDEVIDDLNERLDRYLKKNVTLPLRDQGFQYGFNSAYLRTIIKYWRDEYKWRRREKALNRYPQFKTKINGLDIHYVHVKPVTTKKVEIIPLLLLHGWPSSVKEFFHVIPRLVYVSKDAEFAFELVMPSLPGFGFSDGAATSGLGAGEMAMLMKNLMNRVGHRQFYVAGGDWGSVIAKNLAVLYPDSIKGIHSNMCFVLSLGVTARWILGIFYPPIAVENKFHDKFYPALNRFKFMVEEFGYLHLQATKPDTIGQALEDSPAGLASYILEKFSTWTNPTWKTLPDGGLTRRYSMDDLLDNVMIYWVTNTITSSLRLYKETLNDRHLSLGLEDIPIRVPTACTRYEHEIFWMSKQFIQSIYHNVVRLTDVKDVGHYPAFEKPEVYAEDTWNAFRVLRKV